MAFLNSFRITVLFAVFLVLCYVDWSPKTNQRYGRSPIKRDLDIATQCNDYGNVGVTFDEGPVKTTADILTILNTKKVKATFHLVPSYVQANLDIAKKIVEYGHVIGLRLEPSVKPTELSESELKAELEKEAKIINDKLGVNPRFLRLPFGSESDATVLKVVEELGFTLTLWQLDLSENNKSSNEFVSAYETKLSESYKNQLGITPKFIDRNQEGLATVSDAWYSLINKFTDYQAKIVTLDVCLGLDSPYMKANNATTSGSSKTFLSFTAILFFALSFLFLY